MDNKELIYNVIVALKGFLNMERELLVLNASERSISHKLAEYLQTVFKEWTVDCEYNRLGERPKTLPSRLFEDIKDDDQDAKTIFPDIIIHKRGIPEENILVIEIKKSNSGVRKNKDITKLKAFTDATGDYGYKLGLFIIFDIQNKKLGDVRSFENGEERELQIDIKKKLKALVYA